MTAKPRTGMWGLALTVFMLAGTLCATKLVDRSRPQPLAQPLNTIPNDLDGWSGTQGPDVSDAVEGILKATEWLSRIYRRGNDRIDLFIAFYAEQHSGETIHSPKACLPANGWELGRRGSEVVTVGNDRYEINRYIVEKGLERMTVLYWYQSRSRIVANEYVGKWFMVRDTIVNGANAGSLVRLTFVDRPGAIPAAVGLASHLIPEMHRCIGD